MCSARGPNNHTLGFDYLKKFKIRFPCCEYVTMHATGIYICGQPSRAFKTEGAGLRTGSSIEVWGIGGKQTDER